MILINTTYCVAPVDEHRFLQWATSEYPAAVEKADGSDLMFLRVPSHEPSVVTFAVQFRVSSDEEASRWQTALPGFIAGALAGFGLGGDRLLHFTTLMEVI